MPEVDRGDLEARVGQFSSMSSPLIGNGPYTAKSENVRLCETLLIFQDPQRQCESYHQDIRKGKTQCSATCRAAAITLSSLEAWSTSTFHRKITVSLFNWCQRRQTTRLEDLCSDAVPQSRTLFQRLMEMSQDVVRDQHVIVLDYSKSQRQGVYHIEEIAQDCKQLSIFPSSKLCLKQFYHMKMTKCRTHPFQMGFNTIDHRQVTTMVPGR